MFIEQFRKKKKKNYAKNIYLYVFTAESVCN